jgi:O-antigen ligase
MTPSRTAETESRAPLSGPPRSRLATIFTVALALLLLSIVFGELHLPGTSFAIHYKTLARALPLAWLACLLLPAGRAVLPYQPAASDFPLALFTFVTALSVACGGGHWGDVRNLVAAIGVGLLARSLFAPSGRRVLLIALLGATLVVIVGHELAVHPDLLPPHEVGRYSLVTTNPNVLGFLFAMAAPLLLGTALASRSARRWMAMAGCAVAVLGVLLSFSRVAAVGLAAGNFMVLASLPRSRRALGIGAVVMVAFVAISRPDRWIPLRAPGDGDRPRIMYTALQLALEHPVLGIGFGINNLEEHFADRYEALYGERIFRFHTANQLLDLLAGTGIIGTALALWWVVRVGRRALAHLREADNTAARVTAAGGVGAGLAIALMSMAEPPLYQGKLLPLLFLVLTAIELGPDPADPSHASSA